VAVAEGDAREHRPIAGLSDGAQRARSAKQAGHAAVQRQGGPTITGPQAALTRFAAPPILSSGGRMDSVAAQMKDLLVAALAPRKVILFGSRATGHARPDSDYDVFVVMDTDLPMEDRVLNARLAVRSVPVAKDIFVFTPAEVERYSGWVSGVVREALKTGTVLYEAA
jgi:predicted nucleotidyltransferase